MNHAIEFWDKVAVDEDLDACWEWQGGTNNTGYGTVAWRGKSAVAHRVAAFLSGKVPQVAAPRDRTQSGFVLHKCDNRKCCNPRHFTIGTYAENQLQAYARERRAQPKGSAHANSKITADQVVHLRTLYARGAKQVALASLYGISQAAVSKIVREETYK